MSKSPGYGEKPPLQGFGRSFTAPHRQLSFHERAALDKSDADSGLLYEHPAVRIINFEPPIEAVVSKSSETHADADYPIDTIETLPWRSRTEDLAAAGQLRIEKIQGSVNFLKCGHNFVHSILRNSQCWCVDGESKFVLRKGKLQYYRIELPKETAEDKAKVEELKKALATVLKFEKTPCPFKRAFQVDLPDDAITPRRKGKWKARDTSLLSSPDPGIPTVRKWKSSRPSMPYSPPSAFPDSFNKRRPSDFSMDSAVLSKPAPLQRRSSVAERRAAFENLHSSSRPPSRPQTPASSTSSISHDDQDASDQASTNGEDISEQPPHSEHSQDEADQEVDSVDQAEPPINVREKSEVGQPTAVADQESHSATSSDKQSYPEHDDQVQIQEHRRDGPVPHVDLDESGSNQDLKEAKEAEEHPVDDADNEIVDDALNHEAVSEDNGLADHEAAEILQDSTTTEEAIGQDEILPAQNPVASGKDETKDEGDMAGVHDDLDDDVQANVQADVQDVVKDEVQDEGPADGHDGVEGDVQDDAQADVQDDGEGDAQDDGQDVVQDDLQSVASTTDSFHTTDAAADDDPTLTAESFDPLGAKQFSHTRDISEVTVTASSFSGQNDGETPGTPRLLQSSMSDESWPDVQTPSINDQEGIRQRSKPQRSLSPLPPSTNIVSPPPPRESTTQFTAAIIQKAATMAIVKPVEVVVLVIHVLARIAGGATLNDLLSGGLFQQPERARRHTRNPSFPDRVVTHSSDDEDDFGVPIRGRTRSQESSAAQTARPAPIKEERERESDVDSLFADDLD